MSKTKTKTIAKRRRAQIATWQHQRRAMRHYLSLVVYMSAIITATSTAGWAVAEIAVPALDALIN